ncbi:MAG: GNAT family N-acetyltransferase [Methylotenera sp.]
MTDAQNMNIRLASINDLDPLAQLFDAYRQFYEQAAGIALATTFIKDRLSNQDSIILIALNSEQTIIGFCQLYPTFCSVIAAPICVLYDLFVDSTARKTGAGKALMLAAHEYAANNGFAHLDLTTAKTNFTAQALYESLGWVRDEVFYSYSKKIPV